MPKKPPSNQPKRENKTWNASGFDYSSSNQHWIKLRNHKRMINPLCEKCEERGEFVPVHTVDHIKAILDGGEPYDLDNLQSLCKPCHGIKTAKERHRRSKK